MAWFLVQGISFDGGGGRPDNSLPGMPVYPGNALPGAPVYPGNALPGYGHVDNTLPGGRPVYPSQGLPNTPGLRPDQGLPISPGHPGNALPMPPAYPSNELPSGGDISTLPTTGGWVLVYHPAHGYIWVPAGSLGGEAEPK